MHELPAALEGRVFSRSEALAHGLTPSILRSSRIRSVWPGRYQFSDAPLDERQIVESCRAVAPPDAALSHTSALWNHGLALRPVVPVHFATNTGQHLRRRHLIVHRFEGLFVAEPVNGIPTLAPARTFVDCGTVLKLPELVAVGDWLVANGHVHADTLLAYAAASHLDGVQKARVAAELVRPGSESFQESICRFHLVSHGLPEPDVNVNLVSEHGEFLARGDLPFVRWKVLAEYDGWHHERSAAQRQHDILRRERLEADGWLVVVLTASDLDHPSRAVWRVFNALKSRGYVGRPPRLDPRFGRWMPVSEPKKRHLAPKS